MSELMTNQKFTWIDKETGLNKHYLLLPFEVSEFLTISNDFGFDYAFERQTGKRADNCKELKLEIEYIRRELK